MISEYQIQSKTEFPKTKKKGLNRAANKTLNKRNPKRQNKPKIKPTYTRKNQKYQNASPKQLNSTQKRWTSQQSYVFDSLGRFHPK